MFPNKNHSGSSFAVLLLLLVGPLTARAEGWELRPQLQITEELDDNVFADTDGEQSDAVTRVSPSLRLLHRGEDGVFSVIGGVRSRSYADFDALDTVDRFGSVRLRRRLTNRLRVDLRARRIVQESYGEVLFDEFFRPALFSDLAPAEDGSEDPAAPEEGPAFFLDGDLLSPGRPELDRSVADFNFEYAYDPRTTLTAAVNLWDSEYDNDPAFRGRAYRDTTNRGLFFRAARQLDPLDEVGFTASWGRSDLDSFTFETTPDEARQIAILQLLDPNFEAVPRSGPEEQSTIGRATFDWSRQWTPTWQSAVSAGARRVKSEAGSFSSATLSFSGNAAFTRTSEKSRLSFGYTRDTQPASGESSAVDVDYFFFSFIRSLTPDLTLSFNASQRNFRSAGETITLDARELEVDNQPFFFVGQFGTEVGVNQTIGCRQGSLSIPVPAQGQYIAARDIDGTILETGSGFELTGGALAASNEILARSLGGCRVITDSEIDTDLLSLEARVDWRLRKRFFTFLSLKYRDQDSSGDRNQAIYNRLRGMIGFRYYYDIQL